MIYPPPPPQLERLVEIIGPEAALALVEARGGTQLKIPLHANRGEVITSLIGAAATALLCRAKGGEYMMVPLARQWRILIYARQGLSVTAIALKAAVNERYVKRVLSEEGEERAIPGRQLDLFRRAS